MNFGYPHFRKAPYVQFGRLLLLEALLCRSQTRSEQAEKIPTTSARLGGKQAEFLWWFCPFMKIFINIDMNIDMNINVHVTSSY